MARSKRPKGPNPPEPIVATGRGVMPDPTGRGSATSSAVSGPTALVGRPTPDTGIPSAGGGGGSGPSGPITSGGSTTPSTTIPLARSGRISVRRTRQQTPDLHEIWEDQLVALVNINRDGLSDKMLFIRSGCRAGAHMLGDYMGVFLFKPASSNKRIACG